MFLLLLCAVLSTSTSSSGRWDRAAPMRMKRGSLKMRFVSPPSPSGALRTKHQSAPLCMPCSPSSKTCSTAELAQRDLIQRQGSAWHEQRTSLLREWHTAIVTNTKKRAEAQSCRSPVLLQCLALREAALFYKRGAVSGGQLTGYSSRGGWPHGTHVICHEDEESEERWADRGRPMRRSRWQAVAAVVGAQAHGKSHAHVHGKVQRNEKRKREAAAKGRRGASRERA